MPYILKNNKLDDRYEKKFFEIINENLSEERVERLNLLLRLKSDLVEDFIKRSGQGAYLEQDFENILSHIFTARRHFKKITEKAGAAIMDEGFSELRDRNRKLELRISRFLEKIDYEDIIVKRDIAIELLHFYEPEKNILWTSWIYRPDNGTGCLPYMADFLKRTWDGNPYIMPFGMRDMEEETGYLYELSEKNGLNITPPYGVDILFAYMYSDYVYKMVYAQSKSLSIGVPEGFTLMKKLLGVEKLENVSAA